MQQYIFDKLNQAHKDCESDPLFFCTEDIRPFSLDPKVQREANLEDGQASTFFLGFLFTVKLNLFIGLC